MQTHHAMHVENVLYWRYIEKLMRLRLKLRFRLRLRQGSKQQVFGKCHRSCDIRVSSCTFLRGRWTKSEFYEETKGTITDRFD